LACLRRLKKLIHKWDPPKFSGGKINPKNGRKNGKKIRRKNE
jgi:hypothetical protein